MSTDESSRRLGTTPSAIHATASKRRLAYATLDSTAAILDGLAAHSGEDFTESHEAVRRLRDHLAAAKTTAEVVGPALYEWYFRALRMIRRDELATLVPHARKLPLVAAAPLARAGALDTRNGRPLTLTVPGGGLLLSERPVPGLVLRPGSASIAAVGGVLHVTQPGYDVMEVETAELMRAGILPVPGAPITFWQSSPALSRVVADYQQDLARIHLDPEPFQVLAPDEVSGDHVDRFAAALKLVHRCWPELYSETCALTDHFTLIRGEPFIGGSAISCLGVSFFKLQTQWSDLCFADHIVHEAAHQRLHVEFELEPALRNGGFLGSVSPIRRDPRPLYGVLHATFVFMRLSLFLQRVVEAEPTLEAERRLHRHVLGLYSGLEQLRRHGEWNPRGQLLFQSMCEVADGLREKIPEPDPALYTEVGPDYEPVRSLAAAYFD